eukprot:2154460-Prymnesium_polylepis.1
MPDIRSSCTHPSRFLPGMQRDAGQCAVQAGHHDEGVRVAVGIQVLPRFKTLGASPANLK